MKRSTVASKDRKWILRVEEVVVTHSRAGQRSYYLDFGSADSSVEISSGSAAADDHVRTKPKSGPLAFFNEEILLIRTGKDGIHTLRVRLYQKGKKCSLGKVSLGLNEVPFGSETKHESWYEFLGKPRRRKRASSDEEGSEAERKPQIVGKMRVVWKRKVSGSIRLSGSLSKRRLSNPDLLRGVMSPRPAKQAAKSHEDLFDLANAKLVERIESRFNTDVKASFAVTLKGGAKGSMLLTTTKLMFFGRAHSHEAMLENLLIDLDLSNIVRVTRAHATFVGKGTIEVHTADNRYVFSGFSNRDRAYLSLKEACPESRQSPAPLRQRPRLRTMGSTLADGLMIAEHAETELFEAVNAGDGQRVHELFCCKDPAHEPRSDMPPTPKISESDVNLQDAHGFCALHLMFQHDAPFSMIRDILHFPGTNVNLPTKVDKTTPLHYFCQKFSQPEHLDQCFEWLIVKGAEVNAKTDYGETPLHRSMMNNAIRVLLVEKLLENSADPNIVNKFGEAPLHYAVRFGRKDVVWPLLVANADLSVRGTMKKEAKTPAEIAREENFEEVSELLEKAAALQAWSKEVGLGAYYTKFLEEEMFLEEMVFMDDALMEGMGIKAAGHRIKLRRAVEDLRRKAEDGAAASPPGTDSKKSMIPSLDIDDFDKMLENLVDAEREKLASGDSQINAEIHDELGEEAQWINASSLEFTKKLGTGASGVVYLGLYEGKEVAIKVLKVKDKEAVDEFKKEFRVMSALHSPFVIQLYGACLEPRRAMVMEVCQGGSLVDVLKGSRLPCNWNVFFRFALQATAGIAHLHSQDPPVIHRDIKTPNFLVTGDLRTVKVCDFGLARFHISPNMETMKKVVGTVSYLAPEVFLGNPFTVKADVYSLMIVLWELLTRTTTGVYSAPYVDEDFSFDWQILNAVSHKNLRPTLPQGTPTKLQDFFRRGWSADPEVRPTASELLVELKEMQRDLVDDTSLSGDWENLLGAPNKRHMSPRTLHEYAISNSLASGRDTKFKKKRGGKPDEPSASSVSSDSSPEGLGSSEAEDLEGHDELCSSAEEPDWTAFMSSDSSLSTDDSELQEWRANLRSSLLRQP